MTVDNGRGYSAAAERIAEADRFEQEIGNIEIDALYSPVTRVRYKTEDTRVGQRTNYDRLILEIWTNGTVSPGMALVEAGKILRKYINPFVKKLKKEFPEKHVLSVSAKKGTTMDRWLDLLLSERPGAGTVLREIDYDRYAAAEAVLGWLNAAVTISSDKAIKPETMLTNLVKRMREIFREKNAGIGHLKFALTCGGQTMWINLTGLEAAPSLSEKKFDTFNSRTLLVNARVRMEPEELEAIVRNTLAGLSKESAVEMEIMDLQCFSPAYPNPPYLERRQDD